MAYIVALLGLVLALVCLQRLARRLSGVWFHLIQQPVTALAQARSRSIGETAVNAATLLAPILFIVLLTLYAATWGGQHFATISTLVQHSLGQRHEQHTVGASAAAPIGTGSSARDAKASLRDTSAWAGRHARPAPGRAGGGISGAPLPGKLWSPETPPPAAKATAKATATGCASPAACRAQADALTAWALCAPLIEKAAPPHRWEKAAADMHFNAFSTESATTSVVTYRGDGMLIRGGDGLWHSRTYSCAFDTAADRVLSAQLLPETHQLGE